MLTLITLFTLAVVGMMFVIGIVIAGVDAATVPPGTPEARPIAARVRTDGPLLPPLALAGGGLALWMNSRRRSGAAAALFACGVVCL